MKKYNGKAFNEKDRPVKQCERVWLNMILQKNIWCNDAKIL